MKHVLETVKIGVLNSQREYGDKILERARGGSSHCATPTDKCTQEGFFPSRKRSSGPTVGCVHQYSIARVDGLGGDENS